MINEVATRDRKGILMIIEVVKINLLKKNVTKSDFVDFVMHLPLLRSTINDCGLYLKNISALHINLSHILHLRHSKIAPISSPVLL